MSRLRFSIVAEGETDAVVIEAAIRSILPDQDPVVQLIYPESSAAFEGACDDQQRGWKGVLAWCEQEVLDFGGIEHDPVYSLSSAVVVHIDADVAGKKNLNIMRPCPPASSTTDVLKNVVLTRLSLTACPNKLVVCIPAQSTEAWVLIALYPAEPLNGTSIECIPRPEARLAGKPSDARLVNKNGKRYRKNVVAYRACLADISSAWGHVREHCSQAEVFSRDVASVV